MRYTYASRVHASDGRGTRDNDQYLSVNSVGYYEYDEVASPTHRPKGRRDYYVSYNLHGNLRVLIGGRERILGEQTVFLYRPNEEQFYCQATEQPISNYWVHFTGYGAEELLSKTGLDVSCPMTIQKNDRLAELWEQLISEALGKRYLYELNMSAILQEILIELSRDGNIANLRDKDPMSLVMHKATEYIHKNLDAQLTVAQIARQVGLSASHFTAVFRRYAGTAPLKYIIDRRMEKASSMLESTDLTLTHIASMAGYQDPLYFSRLYRKRVGCSPSEYRDRCRGTEERG
jgi:AraC-like DNA-binding protein